MDDFEDEVVLWVADANGSALPLVELGSVPLDGTWEVLCAGIEDGIEWLTATGESPLFAAAADGETMLVVARPIGSDGG